MGILGSFLGQAAWGSGQYIAQTLAVNAAYKGYDAFKAYGRPREGAPQEIVWTDQYGNRVPVESLRVFGTPGQALRSAHALDPALRDAGIAGEERVARELERLAAFYPNMYIFHSVKLPGRVGDIDHVVIQGDRMMLVDSKNWKENAAYHVYASGPEADYVVRDSENFLGGEIHIRRQMDEWRVAFNGLLQVDASLVIANRTAAVSEAVNAPYSIANIDGLATIFTNIFYQAPVPPLQPEMLNYVLSMVEGITGVHQPQEGFVPQSKVQQGITTKTGFLIAWSIFNWTVLTLLFPLAGISAIPLLITAHLHRAKVIRENLGRTGMLTAVLVFTYVQLACWIPFIAYYLLSGNITHIFGW